ncbi:MAG: SDR family oxidoreductase [Burkholderiales bacterium]|nr:SDR family oxidoreductase [Anaerolineae bacterium]
MSSANNINRHVALITGASKGLGRTLAEFLAARGYDLVLTARSRKTLQETAKALAVYEVTIKAIAGNVADANHRQALITAAQKMGRLDLLVNNASTLGPEPMPSLADYPIDKLTEVFALNTIAPVALTQLALPLLKASHGLVVNLSSDAAVGGYETWGGYGSSKAALDLVSKTLANELRPSGVGVVSIDPGDMRTDMKQASEPDTDFSDLPLPDVTLPFWAWLLGQEPLTVSGQRYQAQAEQWEIVA